MNELTNISIINFYGVMNKDSPKQFDIGCPHFFECSGCLIDQAVNHPPVLDDAVAWFKKMGIEGFALHVGKVTGWRTRAKLAVRGTSQKPLIGLYKEGSHDVIAIPMCQVHHPAINRGVELVNDLLRQDNLTIYNEVSKSGDLRYLQYIVERSTGRLHVTFVLNMDPIDLLAVAAWRTALGKLWQNTNGLAWHSFSINFNTRRDNVIFSPNWELWFGESLLWESFLGTKVCFQPSSFAQANLDQFESLLKTINSWVPADADVAEYYAGGGVIGLTLAEKCRRVRCCEINPHAQFCFDESRKALPPSVADKTSWHGGPSTQYSQWLNEADVIIVDPPRKGLEANLIKSLNSLEAGTRLIYISCGWPSFKNDATGLCQAGWDLQKAEGHLFFPGSNHIETLALFKKQS